MAPRLRELRHPIDVAVERLDVRDVLAAEARQTGAELVIEPDAIRREAVPELPRQAAAARVPVCEDDRLAVASGDGLADRKNRRALVDRDDVARDAERAEGPLVAPTLDDDRRGAVLVDQVLEDPREVLVERLVVYDRPTPVEMRARIAFRSSPATATRLCLDAEPQTIVTADAGTSKRSERNRRISRFAAPSRAGAATRKRSAWRQGSRP